MVFAHASIQAKLLCGFLVTTLFSLIVISCTNFYNAREQFRTVTIDRLTAARETKKAEIEKTFVDLSNQCLSISESTMSAETMHALQEVFNATDVTDTEFEEYKRELTTFYEQVFLPKINETASTKKVLSDFFPQDRKTIIFQTRYIARNPNLLISKREYGGTGDGSSYDKAHLLYHAIYTKYITHLGYSDIYFIDVDTGYVLFNVAKGIDYATNLLTGPFKDTPLAETFRECQKTTDENFVKTTDFAFYDPLYGTPTSFIGTPIFHESKKVGVVIFQFPVNTINNIMTYDKRWLDVGLGTTGEVYLRGNDKLMRSLSRFFIEDPTGYLNKLQELKVSPDTIDRIKIYNTTILLQRAGEAIEKVVDGNVSGTIVDKDYLDNNTLLSYTPLSVPGLDWEIVAKINTDEAFAPINTLAKRAIFWSLLLLILIFIFSFLLVRTSMAPLMLLVRELYAYKTHPTQSVTRAIGSHVGIITEAYNAAITLINQLINTIQSTTRDTEQTLTMLTTQITISIRAMQTMSASITTLADTFRSIREGSTASHLITKQNDVYIHMISDEATLIQESETRLCDILNRMYKDIRHALGSYAEARNSIQDIEQSVMRLNQSNKNEDVRDIATNIASNITVQKELLQKLSDQLIGIEQNIMASTQSIPLRLERHKELCAAVSNIGVAESQRITVQNGTDNAISDIEISIKNVNVQSEHGIQQLQDMQTMLTTLASQEKKLQALIDQITTTT
jgi:hypothetical protein